MIIINCIQWLIVESSKCKACNGTNYDTSTSTAYVRTSSLASYHYYGTAGMMGFNSTDNVYLDSAKSTGVTNFLWFLVLDQYGLVKLNQLIFYSPHKLMASLVCAETINHQHTKLVLYMLKLFIIAYIFTLMLCKQGQISKRIVAFYLTTSTAESFVQIGSYDTKYMKDPSNIVWINSPTNFYWNTNIGGFKYGTTKVLGLWERSFDFSTTTYSAIFDSGTSLIYLPYCNSPIINF